MCSILYGLITIGIRIIASMTFYIQCVTTVGLSLTEDVSSSVKQRRATLGRQVLVKDTICFPGKDPSTLEIY